MTRRTRRKNALFAAAVMALASLLVTSPAAAQAIDLRLNLQFTDPGDGASGGIWEVVAKAEDTTFGIASLSFGLTGINPDLSGVAFNLPTGKVNGSASVNAGFDLSNRFSAAGSVRFSVGQTSADTMSPPATEQSIFYGVGTVANGSPDFVDAPMDATTTGPAFTTLTDVTGVAWATGDFFGAASDPEWTTAVSVATGTFLPTQFPGFAMSGGVAGSIWETEGSATTPGLETLVDGGSISIAETLTNLPILPDYNDNGIVDAPDYAIWRDTLGSTTDLRADGDLSGAIDTADYDLWVANFGAIVPGPAMAQVVTVPEPSSLATATLLLFGLGSIGRRKHGFPTSDAVFPKKREYRKKLLDTRGLASHNAAS